MHLPPPWARAEASPPPASQSLWSVTYIHLLAQLGRQRMKGTPALSPLPGARALLFLLPEVRALVKHVEAVAGCCAPILEQGECGEGSPQLAAGTAAQG